MSVVQLRRLANTRVSNVNKHSADDEVPVRLCNYTDVYYNRTVTDDMAFMDATATPEQVAAFALEDGDTVITKDSETPEDIGIAAYIDHPGDDLVCGYHLAILRPGPGLDPRFLTWAIRSRPARVSLSAAATGMTRFGLTYDAIEKTPIPVHALDEQRRIADFLDDQVARIDNIIATRHQQAGLVADAFRRQVIDEVRGTSVAGPRRDAGIPWLGDVPVDWPVLAVSSQFETVLGKMLDERQQRGEHPLPYLRNTNVQWDRIDTGDLKVMDIAPYEYARCTVRPGDLLICEGGQPGRAAVWDGRLEPLGFQKALHRARSRGRSNPRWLLHCLRAAVGQEVFTADSVTTINHLTGEQLRGQRFPFPDRSVQDRAVAVMDAAMTTRDEGLVAIDRSIELLAEYKQSIITAAVSGELDVTTASGRSLPG